MKNLLTISSTLIAIALLSWYFYKAYEARVQNATYTEGQSK